MAEIKKKKEAKKPEKKARWDSDKRLAREKKRTGEKPTRIRWALHLKKIREMKDEHKKKRREHKANRAKLVEKGVIKQK